jgi:hypothetical protein
MTNHSNTPPDSKEDLENELSVPEGLGQEQPETPSNHSRRVGISKREIMEELSRARFPWDE